MSYAHRVNPFDWESPRRPGKGSRHSPCRARRSEITYSKPCSANIQGMVRPEMVTSSCITPSFRCKCAGAAIEVCRLEAAIQASIRSNFAGLEVDGVKRLPDGSKNNKAFVVKIGDDGELSPVAWQAAATKLDHIADSKAWARIKADDGSGKLRVGLGGTSAPAWFRGRCGICSARR